MNAHGVAVARLGEHSWAPTLSNGWEVNVGTIPPVSSPTNSQPVGREGSLSADAGRSGRCSAFRLVPIVPCSRRVGRGTGRL